METEHNEEPQKKKSMWDLISGIGLIAFGGYRLYSHFLTEATYTDLRLIFAFALMGLGIFNLYRYVK